MSFDDSFEKKALKRRGLSQKKQRNFSLSQDFLLDCCLEVMTLVGWDAFSFSEVSFKKEVPLEDLSLFSSKEEVLEAFFRRINQQVGESLDISQGASFQEVLLESFMVRFEKLGPYKALVKRLYDESFQSPCLGVFLFKNISQELYRPLAFIDKTSFSFYKYFFLFAYSQVFPVWLVDESPDLSRTLFCIDNTLKKIIVFF